MRKSPLPRRNAARTARLFRRNFHSKEFVAFTQSRPCATCNGGPSQCSHAETRGMGGCGADWTRIFPQCGPCHRQYETNRLRFLSALSLTADDIERFITEHRRAWERRQEGTEL